MMNYDITYREKDRFDRRMLRGKLLELHIPVPSVHRCGTGCCMRTSHAAGQGSIPGRDKFPGRDFFGGFPHLLDKCQEAIGPLGP